MFPKNNRKSGSQMRVLRVKVGRKKAGASLCKPAARKRALSFTEWVDQYVKASQGNPV